MTSKISPIAGRVKPGYKTTEFYVTILANVGALSAALAGVLPPRYAAFLSGVSVAAYSFSRGLTKINA